MANYRIVFELTDDDDEEYEEAEGGNRLLGFMFGNVDGSGDLDVDYLDEVLCFFYLPPFFFFRSLLKLGIEGAFILSTIFLFKTCVYQRVIECVREEVVSKN